jgi:mono/diheme cytochrome c family protein
MNQSLTRLLLVTLLLIAIALLLVDLTVIKATPSQGRSAARSRSQAVGDLFRNNCARCHGADGDGDTPLGRTYNTPDFTDPAWWQKHANIAGAGNLAAIVSHGKGGMPAFGRKLNRTEIRRLVDYVMKFRARNQRRDSRFDSSKVAQEQ